MNQLNIIDVGASTGIFIDKIINKFKNAKYYCFEPCKDNFKVLKAKYGNNSKVKLYPKAISLTNNIITFYQANYTNSSSLLPFVNENIKKWKHPPRVKPLETITTYDVESTRLDKFIEDEKIKQIDFLKIDTQGYDFYVIKSLGNYLNIVKQLVLEVQITPFELYKNQGNKNDIINYLKDNNFEVKKVEKWSLDQEENIWFINKNFSSFLDINL